MASSHGSESDFLTWFEESANAGLSYEQMKLDRVRLGRFPMQYVCSARDIFLLTLSLNLSFEDGG